MSMVWPFAQNPASAIPQIIDYDLVISEDYPGIAFVPTIPGGIYGEIRNVSGCMWFATNALFNPNTVQWEQDSPCNPALPAYALVQCEASGTLTWNIAQPAGAINTPLTWVPVWSLNPDGTMVVSPLTLTAQSEIAEFIEATWNAGSAAKMIARRVNVANTSSDASSALDQLDFNGSTEWEVRVDGTLVIGKVPASAIVGGIVSAVDGTANIVDVDTAGTVATVNLHHGDYVDLANAQTIVGEKTFDDPIFFNSSTGSGASTGATGVSKISAWGATFATGPFTFEAHAATAAIIEVKDDGTLNFYSDTGLTPSTTYVPTLRLSIEANGSISTGGTIPPATLAGEFEGTGGVVVSFDGGANKVDVNGAAFVQSITSTGASILVTGAAPTINLEVNTAGTVLPQAGNLVVALDPSGLGAGTAVTIPNPYPGGVNSYRAVATLAGTNHPSSVSLYTNRDSGSQFHVYASSNVTTGNVDVEWTTIPV